MTTNELYRLWKPSPGWDRADEVYRLCAQIITGGSPDPLAHWITRTRKNAAARAAACALHCARTGQTIRERWRHFWRCERNFIKKTGQIDP